MATKIVIDPGHGGYDNGASYIDRKEKDDNLKLGLRVGEILKGMGYDVSYTRTTDVYDSPVQKARIGNELGADFFVSIHRNSSPNANSYGGVQTLIYNDSGIKKIMAKNINSNLEELGFRNINVDVRPDLAVLRRTKMPAILIEAGFINNDRDNRLFDENFEAIAKGIADGINDTISNTNSYAATSTDQRGFDNNASTFSDRKSIYQILVGIFRSFGSANYQMNKLIFDGYPANVYEDEGLFYVKVGEYEDIEEALIAQRELRDRGYETLIAR